MWSFSCLFLIRLPVIFFSLVSDLLQCDFSAPNWFVKPSSCSVALQNVCLFCRQIVACIALGSTSISKTFEQFLINLLSWSYCDCLLAWVFIFGPKFFPVFQAAVEKLPSKSWQKSQIFAVLTSPGSRQYLVWKANRCYYSTTNKVDFAFVLFMKNSCNKTLILWYHFAYKNIYNFSRLIRHSFMEFLIK